MLILLMKEGGIVDDEVFQRYSKGIPKVVDEGGIPKGGWWLVIVV